MGRTTVPVTFVVAPSLYDTPDFVGLRELGHPVHRIDQLPEGFDLAQVDVILGPNCQWYTPQMAGIGALDRIIKRARVGRANRKRKEEAS